MDAFDLTVVGGGPAGYAAAIRGAELGARVILIEKETLGGTCVNRGCIPTKFTLEVAHAFRSIDNLKAFGLNGSLEPLNLKRVAARRNAVVRGIVDGMASALRMNGVQVEQGSARFEGPREVAITRTDGSSRRVAAAKVIIATGAVPFPVQVLGLEEDQVVGAEHVFDMDYIPESLLIVGGGAVGLELATIYNALGSQVTVIEKLPRILPREDTEMVGLLKESLEQSGVSFEVGSAISGLDKDENGNKVAEISNGEYSRKISVQEVIAAHGRMPNITDLGLDQIGITIENRAVKTDARMETNIQGVYAAGDVTGGPMLSHVASAQARVAVDNALGAGGSFNRRVIPRCIYTLPELACVGMTEEEAREKGRKIKVGTASMAVNARAATMASRDGLVKVIADTNNGDLLGVHILGPMASEMIATAVLALNLECKTHDFAQVYQAHPTLGEALDEAIKRVR